MLASLFLIGACSPRKTGQIPKEEEESLKEMALIVYTHPVNPKATFDSLRLDIMQTTWVDSIDIIGRPLTESKLLIEFDSLKGQRYGIHKTDFNKQLKEKLPLDDLKRADRLLNSKFKVGGGREVPLSALAEVRSTWDFYLPHIYIPEPKTFTYDEKEAVKVILYGGMKNEQKLREFINKRMPQYFYYPEFLDYEIIVE